MVVAVTVGSIPHRQRVGASYLPHVHRSLSITVTAPLVATAALGLVTPMSADTDDQAAADSAVAVFGDRLTEAGWTSTGQPEVIDPQDAAANTFGDCLGGFEVVLENTGTATEGETARAYSDEFELVDDDPASTELSFDMATAAAIVVTVAKGSEAPLDRFVEALGSDDTPACMQKALAGTAADGEDAGNELTVQTQSDLGVGDASALTDFVVVSSVEGAELSFSASIAAARVDRSIVAIVIGASGMDIDLDPVAELEAIVDSLA